MGIGFGRQTPQRGPASYGRRRMAGATRRSSGVRWLPIVLFGVYLLYYFATHQSDVPMTGRSQLIDMNRQQEAALGLQSYRQILGQSRVLAAGEAVDSVRAIGERLAAVSDEPGFQWEFNVIESDQANAFALPGGKVAVYTGILPIAKTVDGLSAIMGHEIAHAIARHGAERMAYQKLAQIGTMAASAALSDMDDGARNMVMGALGVGSQFGVLLPFSRKHESEADYMGLIYTARACFDPREAPRIWERMAAASGGQQGPSEFMSTHPSHETRIEKLNAWMPEALEVHRRHCGG